MNWLSQNWIWLVALVGILWFVTRRGGAMGGCGMAHEGPREATKPQSPESPPSASKEAVGQGEKPAGASHRHGGCC